MHIIWWESSRLSY